MRRCRPLLGTFVEIEAADVGAIDCAFAAIARVHALMSAHDPDSDLSRINRFAHRSPIEVSTETIEVLERAIHWWRASGGLFDVVTAGARSLAEKRIPHHSGQPQPVLTDSRALRLAGRMVRLTAPACLDLGGIAKGYAVDEAIRAMRRFGVPRALVNAGGDLFGFGPTAWTVAVIEPGSRRPLVEVPLHDEALATSAYIDGSSAHLPSGTRWSSVTVRAPNACDADALTKIVWAEPAKAGRLLDLAGACAFGIRADGKIEEVGKRALAA